MLHQSRLVALFLRKLKLSSILQTGMRRALDRLVAFLVHSQKKVTNRQIAKYARIAVILNIFEIDSRLNY